MPVAENCNKKKESFLCKYPLLDFKQISKVPVIIGMNSGEGGLFASRKLLPMFIIITDLIGRYIPYIY